ncbi:MAG: hypothetical protein JXX28_15740, partial [Deltaproteobacteria bacterium]|nr:hypothetical protein [Deltaproteobacteria bacterium]
AGEPAQAAPVTVKNSPPAVAGATVSPAAPDTLATLSCGPSGGTDPDRDTISYRVRWLVGGAEVSRADQLTPDKLHRGDAISCELTPFDGTDTGSAVRSEAVTVRNTPPVLRSVSQSPAEVLTNTSVRCTPGESTDADGDKVQHRYAWLVNGVPLSGQTGERIAPEHFSKGQSVQCEVTPFDGSDAGRPVRGEAARVGNTAPVLSSVAITPSAPTTTDSLRCEPGPATDEDGDRVSFSYKWTVDQRPAGTAQVLPAAAHRKGQRVSCEVTPLDGTLSGSPVTAKAVQVVNTPPTLSGASISPAVARVTDPLVCTAQRAADADGDKVDFRYAWQVNGRALGSHEATLAPGSVKRGDTVTCTITPQDDEGGGEAVVSASPRVDNTAPRLNAVTILPQGARTSSTLTAEVDAEDADGDSVDLSFAWSVNGRPAGSDPTLAPSLFKKGDRIELRVTPRDEMAVGTAASAPPITVANTPPGTPIVVIGDPKGGYSDMVCHVFTDVSDDDGDPLAYHFSWTVNGRPASGATQTKHPGDTVPEGLTHSDEEWVCNVKAWDGTAEGAAGSQSTHIIQPIVQGGSGHTCWLDTWGDIHCWGVNEQRVSQPPQGHFLRLAAGAWHNCAMDDDGQLACWGNNRYKQCDPPQGVTFTQLSAGGYHTCGVDSSAQLRCWGQDRFGQASPPAGAFSTVSAGWTHSCAISTTGQLACWGDNAMEKASPPQGRYRSVSLGANHACALREDGAAVCWGDNEFNQTQAPSTRFTQVEAGENYTCGLTEDGAIACWGFDNFGQIQSPAGTYRWLGRGSAHICAINSDVEVVCWGRDNYGQIEVPEGINRPE